MVMLTSSEPPGSSFNYYANSLVPPGSSYNYYATRRTPFEGLHNHEVVRYNSEITPVYSEHDARIRGVSSESQRITDGYLLQDSTDNALVERSSSQRRETQRSLEKAQEGRSSSCSRAVQTSSRQLGDAREYIQHRGGDGTKEYVIEEQIHPQFNYHIPSKTTQMEIMTMGDNAGRAKSVPPRLESPSSEWIRIPREQGLFYFAPLNSNEHHQPWFDPNHPKYYDNRRAMLSEPQGSELKYWSKIIPSDSYDVKQVRASSVDNTLNRSRSLSRNRFLQHQVISADVSPSGMYNMSTSREENKMALVPFEPQGSELTYWSKVIPSDSYDVKQVRTSSVNNTLNRSRSLSRNRVLQHQVISEDVSPSGMYNISTSREQNKMALVPFEHSQSMPPAQTEYRSQWIKIPAGPATITVHPTISSSDPRTWTTQREPLQITNYDSRRAVDSNHSHVDRRSSSQSKEQADQKFVTYEHIPKPDMSLEKKKIDIDQRYDRSHKDNRGSDYRSKWVSIARGPNAYIYRSIHSRDKEAMMEPGLTGYVGDLNHLESREKSEKREKSQYTRTSDSFDNMNYAVNKSTSRVNKILNSKEDFEKKHFVDMLFNIKRIIKEREELGVYEIPQKMKNKLNYLTSAVNTISKYNRSPKYTDSYPTESCKSLLSFSNLLAPILPDHGRTNAISRFNYMLHGPRVHVTMM